jgi:hypothetical protein
MLNNIEGFDFGKKKTQSGVEYSYTPRKIESINDSQDGLDHGFDLIISSLHPTMKEDDRDALLLEAGKGIGRYLKIVSEEKHGDLDIVGEMRSLAGFQGFLEREIMKRGPTFTHLFREPSLLSGINEEAPFMHSERINEKMRGAQSTVEYVHLIEKDKSVIFIGSEVGLDCRHAIDLVVGRGKEDFFEVIDLVQVKTSQPASDDVSKIIQKHRAYSDALRNFEVSAVGADENSKNLERIGESTPEEDGTRMKEFYNFYDGLTGLFSKLDPAWTWQSLVEAAKLYNHDPVLFYVRLKDINESRLLSVPQRFKQNMLRMVKDNMYRIEIPQSEMAAYSLAKRGPGHITSASTVYSVIVANGREVSRIKLTK